MQDSLLFNSCFSVYRCDRNRNNSEKHSGGGVLIAVHRRLVCREFARAENNEAICVRIDTMNGNIFLCCGYIPPTSNVHRYQSFAQFVESIIETVGPHDVVLVFGDFNLPNLKWNQRFQEGNNCFLLPDRITTQSEMAIVDGFLSAGLMQVCDLPNQNNNYLDLIFTTDTESCQAVVTDPIIKHEVHHYAMQLTIATDTLRELEAGMPKTHLNLELMNVASVKEAIRDVSWSNVFISQSEYERNSHTHDQQAASMLEFLNSLDVLNCELEFSAIVSNIIDFNVLSFYFVLFSIFSRFAPFSRSRSIRESRYPEWFSPILIQVLKDKRKALKKKRRNPSPENIASYKELLATFKVLHREAYQVYISKIQNGIKANPKSFWKFVNGRRKNAGVPQVMKYGNRSSANGQDTAQLFAEYFKSVYRDDIPNDYNPPINAHGDVMELSQDEVNQGLADLDSSKTAGPDKLPAKILKEFKDELCEPLSILFNSSLSSGYFPHLWKISHLILVHKKGSRSDTENYRGIAIQSATPKLFERLVYVLPSLRTCQ